MKPLELIGVIALSLLVGWGAQYVIDSNKHKHCVEGVLYAEHKHYIVSTGDACIKL